MENNYTVYMHISPSGKRYIGITKQKVNERWKNGLGYRTQQYFYKAIEKYGWDNFQHIIIATNLSEEQAKEMEIELIEKYNSTNRDKGYNITKGGEGVNGWTPTEEWKQKRSKVMKGHNVSEETRNKISKSLMGHKASEETKEKQSKVKIGENNPMYGKKRPELTGENSPMKRVEVIAKFKGKNNSNARSVICITTKKIFYTLIEASKFYNITSCSNIMDCCKGKRKSAGKYNNQKLKWKYLIWQHNKKLRVIHK